MRALVTGFEPFDSDTVNPSSAILPLLPRRLGEVETETRVLPCVFGEALRVLGEAVAAIKPDIVLCVGLAGGRAELSLERVAINVDDARIADNDGNRPVDVPVIAEGPPAYFSGLRIKAAVAELRRAGLPAGVSNSAGTFVCNHTFYGVMHLAAERGFRAGFLHVPYLPEQAVRHPGAPSMALADIARGIEIVLSVAAARGADIAVSEGTFA
ncbi:MAG TPA: pyroglutamyl-peptidase I [Stellaceae bacterium]|jgi:pyroglutamyl-peptidase